MGYSNVNCTVGKRKQSESVPFNQGNKDEIVAFTIRKHYTDRLTKNISN